MVERLILQYPGLANLPSHLEFESKKTRLVGKVNSLVEREWVAPVLMNYCDITHDKRRFYHGCICAAAMRHVIHKASSSESVKSAYLIRSEMNQGKVESYFQTLTLTSSDFLSQIYYLTNCRTKA